MEYLEGMLQKEKDNFSRVCNRLLETRIPKQIIILC